MVPTMKALAPRYRVYAPDLPGFGRSEGPRQALDVPGLADALASWIEAVGIDGASFVANSMGCQVVADLAVRRPDLTREVVLQGPTMDPAARSVARQVGRFLIDVFREPAALLAVEARDLLDAGVVRGWRTLRHALEDRIEARLPRVGRPALVVHGSRDPIVSREWAAEAARLLPHGRLVAIPEAAHAANFDAPEALARVVRAFLEEGRG
jgi:pimeloyl-ACP methyl ester carboxylesterase